MSAKNKAKNKAIRGRDRETKRAIDGSIPRYGVSSYPYAPTMALLTDPKLKMRARSRKKFLRVTHAVVARPQEPARDYATTLMLALSRAPLRSVIRTMKRSARRSATLKHLIAKLSPQSITKLQLEAAQTEQIGILGQAAAEFRARVNHSLHPV
jgi:hypothetical protein